MVSIGFIINIFLFFFKRFAKANKDTAQNTFTFNRMLVESYMVRLV